MKKNQKGVPKKDIFDYIKSVTKTEGRKTMEQKTLTFRLLHANEIECAAEVNRNGIKISLYTKAATCTKLLNETVGPMNWEKAYNYNNRNCVVSIWDSDKNRMIAKEDCGGDLTKVDGLKGQASNGFKRVCALGWGLGIELYSQPLIILNKNDTNVILDEYNNEVVFESYDVRDITYDNETRTIKNVVITDSNGTVVYDGPDDNGHNRINNVMNNDDEVIDIPENADEVNAFENEINETVPCVDDNVDTHNSSDMDDNVGTDAEANNSGQHTMITPHDKSEEKKTNECAEEDADLPDNTDRYEEQKDETIAVYVKYREMIENEVVRTHVRKSDVLKALGIKTIRSLPSVDIVLIEAVLNRLKQMKSYQ